MKTWMLEEANHPGQPEPACIADVSLRQIEIIEITPQVASR
jgi:hypothetical protein